MSPRNFARAFARETGVTPGSYVETLRIERARQSLERDWVPIEAVAGTCGFGTPETMRRAFSRRLSVSPAEYRARFRREPETAGSARREG
ncbi:MAG: helix-turn-helix domain-containing protein [Solirubrobacterales bacterium]